MAETAFAHVARDAEQDSRALAAFLIGSRATDLYDASSDFDICVVFADEEASRTFAERYRSRHGDDVEVISTSMERFEGHGEYGSASEWARPQYLHVRVLFDKTNGELDAALTEKRSVPEDVRRERLPKAIDSYVNSYFRSARNAMVGLDTAARLDAVESLPHLLDAIFMFDARVRPFNKHLALELRQRPLSEAAWSADRLLPVLVTVCDGDGDAQRELFRTVERVAGARGFGYVIEGWEPDVAWLRGEAAYRDR